MREKYDINSNLYDYDLKEHVIVLTDWSDEMFTSSKYENFLYANGDDTLDSILIQGRGIQVRRSSKQRDISTKICI